MSIILKRFFELMIMCVLFSGSISILSMIKVIYSINKITIVCIVIYAIMNMLFMYLCYMFLMSKKLFYFYNYIAYFLFCVVTYIAFFIMDENLYSFFFGITDFFGISNIKSFYVITAFHLIMLLIIGIIPFGIHRINMHKEEQLWITDVFDEEWVFYIIYTENIIKKYKNFPWL